ncbi:MAG: rod shape-determining protein RodA [Deltaproteobacteria bacterium]|nr:rod shape-determining protein RodA [Deltaproteobacteria bacterium]
MFDRRLVNNFDWILLAILIFIGLLSVFNLYSATHSIGSMGGSHVYIKQICWYAIGFFILLLMTTFDYHVLDRLAYPLFFISLIFLLVVLRFGKVTYGSQRWLSLGYFSIQPSEMVKISIIIVLAKYFSNSERTGNYRLRDLTKPLILIAIPFVMIVYQPDLGTALVLLIVSISIVIFVNVNWKSIAIFLSLSFLSAPFFWITLQEYQKKRIITFLRPDLDPLGAAYHVTQSKIAIGSGLLWGKGFLKGTQTRLHFLPQQHTDFSFSVLAEEWGFVGSAVILLVYLFLILWCLNIAKSSKDKFGTLIVVGVAALVFWHLIINVSMVIGLLPVVGIPLALFSYGGSSVISTMAAMGLVMNISMRRFMFQE